MHPVKVESLSQPSGSPESKPYCPSKPNILGALLSGVGPPELVSLMWGLDPSLLGEKCCTVIAIILPFVSSPPGGMDLDYIVFLPFLPYYCFILVSSLYL